MHRKDFLRRSFAFAAACAMAGCAVEDPVSTSIGKAVERGPGARVVLADHATFPWGTACIFAPYTTDGDVDAVTRVRGASRDAHDIAGRDDINLLMFVEQGRIVRSVAHRRDRGDFGPELAGKCFARDRAVFSVRTAPSGSRGTIGPG